LLSLLKDGSKIGEAHISINSLKNQTVLELIGIQEQYQNQGYGSILMNKVFQLYSKK